MVVTCLARISRLHYPTLVSKRFLSLLASPELYKTPSLLNRTESCCLYVCLQYRRDPNARWFTLSKKPTLTNDTKKEYVLAPIPVPQSPPAFWSGLVSIGSNIYNIGVPINKAPSSSVSVLDCRSNTWLEAPNMHVERKNPCASVVDGKIYVTGGREELDSSNWMEVFDPKTQSWELVSCPFPEICENATGKSVVIEGKIYLFGYNFKGLAYTPKEEKWETIRGPSFPRKDKWGIIRQSNVEYVCPLLSDCVIDNKVYRNDNGIKWYDCKIGRWLDLKGLSKFWNGYLRFVDYGGKLAVLWDEYLPSSTGNRNMMIWCAVVVLERRSTEEMWGEVESLDAVLTVPTSYKLWSALSATV